MNFCCGYYTNRHSCFLLQYHLVLVTKYRRKAITGPVRDDLLQYTEQFFSERGCVLQEINTDLDHIHILFDAPPQLCLSEFINAFKSASSRHLRSRHARELARFYWKPVFWSRSYFIATVSDRSVEAVRHYIQNQGL